MFGYATTVHGIRKCGILQATYILRHWDEVHGNNNTGSE